MSNGHYGCLFQRYRTTRGRSTASSPHRASARGRYQTRCHQIQQGKQSLAVLAKPQVTKEGALPTKRKAAIDSETRTQGSSHGSNIAKTMRRREILLEFSREVKEKSPHELPGHSTGNTPTSFLLLPGIQIRRLLKGTGSNEEVEEKRVAYESIYSKKQWLSRFRYQPDPGSQRAAGRKGATLKHHFRSGIAPLRCNEYTESHFRSHLHQQQ